MDRRFGWWMRASVTSVHQCVTVEMTSKASGNTNDFHFALNSLFLLCPWTSRLAHKLRWSMFVFKSDVFLTVCEHAWACVCVCVCAGVCVCVCVCVWAPSGDCISVSQAWQITAHRARHIYYWGDGKLIGSNSECYPAFPQSLLSLHRCASPCVISPPNSPPLRRTPRCPCFQSLGYFLPSVLSFIPHPLMPALLQQLSPSFSSNVLLFLVLVS